MRRIYLLGALLLCSLVSMADNLVLEARDASGAVVQTFPVTTATVLTFNDAGLVVTNGEDVGNALFSSFATLNFAEGAVGIGHLTRQLSEQRVLINGGLLTVPGQNGALTVYTVDGRQVLSRSAYNGETVDISQLAAGVYLAKINRQTIKFVKK